MDVLLGEKSDRSLAKEWGISINVVGSRRKKLNIPNYDPALDRSLHQQFRIVDSIGSNLGVDFTPSAFVYRQRPVSSSPAVKPREWRRQSEMIAAVERKRANRRTRWTNEMEARLGTTFDGVLAKEWNIDSPYAVQMCVSNVCSSREMLKALPEAPEVCRMRREVRGHRASL